MAVGGQLALWSTLATNKGSSMKYVIVLASLLTLLSCESKTSSKSKKCTYNDVPVDCSTMNSVEAEESFSLVSKVKSEITLSDNQIEILENTEDKASETRNGYVYDCNSSTTAGNIFKYKVIGKSLQLKLNDAVENFTRITGDSKSIVGSWIKIEKDETGSSTITIVFTEENMEITVECFFK